MAVAGADLEKGDANGTLAAIEVTAATVRLLSGRWTDEV
jgi:hypothetical protein